MTELVATYGRRSGGLGDDKLLLEQSPWAPYVGGLTKFAMAAYLANLIYGEGKYKPYYNCGLEDGRYTTLLYVYPLVDGLNYDTYMSHGSVGDRRERLVLMTEVVKVALDDTITLKYPVRAIRKAVWRGDCFNRQLDKVSPPALTISADLREVRPSSLVYGLVEIKYETYRHEYLVTVTRRDEDTVENKYSCVALCVYYGRPPQLLELTPPPAAEELDGECARGGDPGHFPDPDDPRPPDLPDPHADVNEVRDWCTKERISISTVGV